MTRVSQVLAVPADIEHLGRLAVNGVNEFDLVVPLRDRNPVFDFRPPGVARDPDADEALIQVFGSSHGWPPNNE